MSPLLIPHITAGSLAIVSGAWALSVRKGERLHRAFGTVFFLSMLMTSALAVCLALFVPTQAIGAAPPKASVAVATLTFYYATTAWMTVKRREGSFGLPEKAALLVALGVTTILLVFGLQAANIPAARPGDYVPYFVFGSFAAIGAAGDLNVILRGGISGAQRIARHLWRMCFTLFFATSFFFLGQQNGVLAFMRGSPILLALAIAPLLLMIFWLVRVRWMRWYRHPAK